MLSSTSYTFKELLRVIAKNENLLMGFLLETRHLTTISGKRQCDLTRHYRI